MHQNSSAVFRPELQQVVTEAMGLETSYIADLLFPPYPVSTRTGKYAKIKRGKGQLMTNADGNSKDILARAPGTAYPEFSRTSEDASWSCTDRGATTPTDDVNAQDVARFFDMESANAAWIMSLIRSNRESRVASFVNNEARWGKITAPLAFTLANLVTFDAPELIKEAKRLLTLRQERANTLVMSRNLFDLVTGSEKMLKYCLGSLAGTSSVTRQMIAEKFELGQILVGEAAYDVTKPGKDSSDANLRWAWGDDYMFMANVQGGAPETGGIGRNFILDELTNGGQLFVTESWREEKTRCTQIRVRMDCDENTVNETSGLLIKVNSL